LLYDQPSAKVQFGIECTYEDLLNKFIEWICVSNIAYIYLIPHVYGKQSERTSDENACKKLFSKLNSKYRDNVILLEHKLNQNETKWLIGQMDWFFGTRMHSTIAAISSYVPTINLAYSDKAYGVFDTCGLSESVFDMRTNNTNVLFQKLISSWKDRTKTKKLLETNIPKVIEKAKDQMEQIVDCILAL